MTERRWQPPEGSGLVPRKPYTNSNPTRPYEKGNELALKHGLRSAKKVDPVATEILERTLESAPHLSDPSYAATALAWSRLEAQLVLGQQYLDTHGLTDDEGRVRPVAYYMLRVEGKAQKLREELGLTPASRAALEHTVAQAQGSWLDALRKQREEETS